MRPSALWEAHMSVHRISALAVGLVLVAGTLTGGSAQAVPGPAAGPAAGSTSSTVTVSITAAHNVVLPATIQPGVNQLRVTTEARSSAFQLLQLAAGYTLDQAIADIDNGLDKGRMGAFRRFEANVTLLGGITILPGRIGKVTLDLEPGTYYAADVTRNRPSAFTAFTVAGADTGATMPAGPTIKAVDSASWSKRPRAIPRRGTMTFENVTDQNHFVGLVRLRKGKTAKDFGTWLEAQVEGQSEGENGPPPVDFSSIFDSGVVSAGHTVAMNYRLARGSYVLLCFWPDASMGGMPHAFMGMYRGIELE